MRYMYMKRETVHMLSLGTGKTMGFEMLDSRPNDINF